MKKSIYFTTTAHNQNQSEQAITQATNKRDVWLKENKDSIGKICDETIHFVTSAHHLIVTIQISYFEK